jgi:hypothetical protein
VMPMLSVTLALCWKTWPERNGLGVSEATPHGKAFETNGHEAVWYESNDCHRRDCQAAGAIEEDASRWRVGRDRNLRRLSA